MKNNNSEMENKTEERQKEVKKKDEPVKKEGKTKMIIEPPKPEKKLSPEEVLANKMEKISEKELELIFSVVKDTEISATRKL